MTRLTIRRGGTKRLRATYFTDQPAGIVRDLTGLSLIIIEASSNIAAPAVSILSPASLGQIQILWGDEQTAALNRGLGRVWLTLGLENASGEREVLPTLTFDVE